MVQRSSTLDAAFTAVADPVRRGILDRLGTEPASISALAEMFDMTLTGMKKHVSILEDAGLVRTRKLGRVRTCSLGPARLTDAAAWIQNYQRIVEERCDHLGSFLQRTRRDT